MSPKKAVSIFTSAVVLLTFLALGVINGCSLQQKKEYATSDWMPPGSTVLEKHGGWYVIEFQEKKFLFYKSVYKGFITQIVEPPKCEENN